MGVTLLSDIASRSWITLRSGVYYMKHDNVVYVTIDLGGSQGMSITSSGVNLGTLPSGCRPSSQIQCAAVGKANNIGMLRVTTGGDIVAFLFGSTSVYFAATVSYPAF